MDDTGQGTGDPGWHSYRCPVCGHADEVELAGEVGRTVPCSHCATSLELRVMAPDQASVVVSVARRWRRSR
jgi:uncharacterized Zn finger protein